MIVKSSRTFVYSSSVYPEHLSSLVSLVSAPRRRVLRSSTLARAAPSTATTATSLNTRYMLCNRGVQYREVLQGALELETKVQTKVRNHGEGPY